MAALRLDPNSNEAMMLFGFLFGDSGVSDRDIATLHSEAQGHANDPVPHFVLGLAYAATRSLWLPIIAHATTNLALGLYVVTTGNWKFW